MEKKAAIFFVSEELQRFKENCLLHGTVYPELRDQSMPTLNSSLDSEAGEPIVSTELNLSRHLF